MKTKATRKEYQEYLHRKAIYKAYNEKLGADNIATIRALAVYQYLKGMLKIDE